jgi:hypothetical protein
MQKMRPLGITGVTKLNEGFNRDRNILAFDGIDNTGDDITQSPIWIRLRSLLESPLPGYSQIVGHTPVYRIAELPLGVRDERGNPARLIQIDTGDYESVYRF